MYICYIHTNGCHTNYEKVNRARAHFGFHVLGAAQQWLFFGKDEPNILYIYRIYYIKPILRHNLTSADDVNKPNEIRCTESGTCCGDHDLQPQSIRTKTERTRTTETANSQNMQKPRTLCDLQRNGLMDTMVSPTSQPSPRPGWAPKQTLQFGCQPLGLYHQTQSTLNRRTDLLGVFFN